MTVTLFKKYVLLRLKSLKRKKEMPQNRKLSRRRQYVYNKNNINNNNYYYYSLGSFLK